MIKVSIMQLKKFKEAKIVLIHHRMLRMLLNRKKLSLNKHSLKNKKPLQKIKLFLEKTVLIFQWTIKRMMTFLLMNSFNNRSIVSNMSLHKLTIT